MVLPEKNLSSPPPQKKKKAVGLALSVRKNSGLARPKKKELAPFEIENRGASVIGQGQPLVQPVQAEGADSVGSGAGSEQPSLGPCPPVAARPTDVLGGGWACAAQDQVRCVHLRTSTVSGVVGSPASHRVSNKQP